MPKRNIPSPAMNSQILKFCMMPKFGFFPNPAYEPDHEAG
jgi:hypothetical protein